MVQRLASRLWPAGLHPGGLGWSLATSQLAGTIVIAEQDGDPVGWAGVDQPGGLLLQVEPLRRDAARTLVRWLRETAEGPTLAIEVFAGSSAAAEALAEAGFSPSEPSPTFYGHRQVGLEASADAVTAVVPAGYSVRSVRPDEREARVEVHRASWRPADLPFDPEHRPFLDSSWTSPFNAEQYAKVQRTWLYRTDLDLVAAATDGSLAGCCVVWFDPASGWGEIEPLGVIPAHRGQGLAGALCAEAARRIRGLGGHQVHINTGPSTSYPAPYGAYRKAGFVDHVRSRTYSRAS